MGKKSGTRGPDLWNPTEAERKQVKAMSSYGIPQEAIASVLGTNAKTLCRVCKEELALALTKANTRVAGKLFSAAMGSDAVFDAAGNIIQPARPPNTGAQIFWLKARAGWSERHELSGPGGIPLAPTPLVIEFVSPNKKEG